MSDLLRDAANRSISYLESLGERRVSPSPEAVARLSALNVELPQKPTDPAAVLANRATAPSLSRCTSRWPFEMSIPMLSSVIFILSYACHAGHLPLRIRSGPW